MKKLFLILMCVSISVFLLVGSAAAKERVEWPSESDLQRNVDSAESAELAYEKSLGIINNYNHEPRSEDTQKELDRIYKEFEDAVKERKERAAAA